MENSEITTEKSPGLDRNVIEELNNLDRVTLRNLRDWDKKVGGTSETADPVTMDDKDQEWSPSSTPEETAADTEDGGGATSLSYADIANQQPGLMDASEGEITDSDIETAGSEADRDDLTDYENSEMVEYQAAVEAGLEDEERQCWVCFASQDDDPVAAWVHPCLCKGTTKWVHQVQLYYITDVTRAIVLLNLTSLPQVCIQRWVDEKQKGNSNAGVSCPQCGADYVIQFPESPGLMRLLDTLDKLVGRMCPVIAGGVCVGSLYWTCVTYGAITVMQVSGHDKGLSLMERADPLFLLVSLPLVPVGLVLGKMVRWQDPVLRALRARLPRFPLTKYILPAFAAAPEGEGSTSAANLPPPSDPVSMTRTFCGALFFPTVAVFLGNALFEHEKSPLRRACMGGFCFVGAKGVLKIYHKQHQYIRQSKRLILDYQQ